MVTLEKRRRITGPARDQAAEEAETKYSGGASVRAIAESLGRSYGFVHKLLEERGVTMRPKGGNTRGAR